MSAARPVRWGVAATGSIAAKMVAALGTIADADVVAVGSRTQASADAFARRHGIERAHGTYTALWADDGVDVVYVASPHSEHHPMTLAALAAGRHVLCEKAFAVNRAQAVEMVDAARSANRFLMEAMWSWFMPGWHELRRRIADGAIGEVVVVEANFGLRIDDREGRHHRRDLTGGALLDLGIYPLALGRFLLGEPDGVVDGVRALGTLTEAGVDARLGGVVRHRSGALTVFHTSLDATSDLGARIVGTEGSISIAAPFWVPSTFTVTRHDGSPAETVDCPNRGLAHEAEHAMGRIRDGELESDIVTWDVTLANMALMDELRRQVGVVYPED